MTVLLELKQKIKNWYGRYEIYLLPVFKFALAFLFFYWIDTNMGYMPELNNLFVVLVLALICSILPSAVMVFCGFVLIVGHAYRLSLEAGIFALVLILLLAIVFLRFSNGQSVVLVCGPLSFGFEIPVLTPIGSGLLGNAFSVFPAASGVIIFYFIQQLRQQAEFLQGDTVMVEKFRVMADTLITNWAMWLEVLAFIVTILMVNLIRTRSFDYAWRVAIVTGGITYVLVMFVGSMFLAVEVQTTPVILQTLISVAVGLVLEFFFFGGDYSRTERMQYEDDDYYYFVKAVPKASISTSERSVKKITGQPSRAERQDPVISYEQSTEGKRKKVRPVQKAAPVEAPDESVPIDYEKKLEESLKDL